MSRILVVEDEDQLRRGIKMNLEAEGYQVADFPSADSAWREFDVETSRVDLGILDVMMPGQMDGYELCRRLRQKANFPVIFLSARDALEDKLTGFESGAADYLTKPFELEELLARVAARLRERRAREIVNIGNYRVDLTAGTVTGPGLTETLRLNERENRILTLLAEKRGTPVSRDEILDRAWGVGEFPSNRSVDNHIVRFRKIFESEPNQPRWFITRHGVGYELAPEE